MIFRNNSIMTKYKDTVSFEQNRIESKLNVTCRKLVNISVWRDNVY